MFTRPGFQLKELDRHRENGTLWRRLHVTFPADIPTHCHEQTFYFNQEGVLQRTLTAMVLTRTTVLRS